MTDEDDRSPDADEDGRSPGARDENNPRDAVKTDHWADSRDTDHPDGPGGDDDPLGGIVDDIDARDRRSEASDPADGRSPSEGGSSETDPSPDDRSETGARSDGERAEPLGDLASDLDRRRESRDRQVDEELFDEESVPEIDPETVWEQVERDDPTEAERTDPDERVERVIDTGSYCENCEYFSEPPGVHCTHEGTEIVEMVDIDHFRVLDCPVVREDERLEQL